jgi:hypothetical protein
VDPTYVQDILKTVISFASVRIRNKALGHPVRSLDLIEDEGFSYASFS